MYDLTRFTLADLIDCGAELQLIGAECAGVFEAADGIAEFFTSSFASGAGPQIQASRIYVTCEPSLLPERLRGENPHTGRCLFLAASSGEVPKWDSTRSPAKFFTQLFPESDFADDAVFGPLIAATNPSLGLVADVADSAVLPANFNDSESLIFENARDVGVGPRYRDLLLEHDIKSLIAFSANLPNGEMFILELFCLVPVGQSFKEIARVLGLCARMSFLHHCFELTSKSASNMEELKLRAELAAVKQILARQNVAVRLHTDHLQKALNFSETERMADRQKQYLLTKQKHRIVDHVAHDFRTPLIGALRILKELLSGTFGPMDTKQKEVLKKIYVSDSYMLSTVQNVLDAYREGRDFHFESLDMTNVVKGALTEVELLADDKAISLDLRTTDLPAVVNGDAQALRRVMVNLLSNAIKHSPSGGGIAIVVERRENRILVSVEDHGVGVSLDLQSRVFDQIHTADEKYRALGSGLGLFVCRAVVTAHGGIIWYQATPGKGATFLFELPCAVAAGDVVPHSTPEVLLPNQITEG